MPSECISCGKEIRTVLWCEDCECLFCASCIKMHEAHPVRFCCQECQRPPATNAPTEFCENCEQHLCLGCSEKIHNKGKRAKHKREVTEVQALRIKHLYFIFLDSLEYYGYISFEALLLEFRDAFTMEDGSLIMLERATQKTINHKLKIEKFNEDSCKCKEFTNRDFDEDFIEALQNRYPLLQTLLFIDSKEGSKKIQESKDAGTGLEIKVVKMGQQVQSNNKSLSSISIQSSSKNRSNKYSREIPQNTSAHHQSSSTENSLKRRKYKNNFDKVNENRERESETFSDFNSLYKVMDGENSEFAKTVIIRGSVSSLNIVTDLLFSKVPPVEENSRSSSGFSDVMEEMERMGKATKGQHNRINSSNTGSKPQNHFRVYSNISRD